MNEFHIDRASGTTIFIDVEAGIVQKCKNESERFIKRMDEKYIGNPIQYLIDDIAKAFKGVYMNVRSTEVVDQQRRVSAIESHVTAINSKIQMELRTIHQNTLRADETTKYLKELEVAREKLIVELSGHETILNTIKENVRLLHNLK